ncbi:hypothetical protein N7466_005080 [Penicillium verhagenii]|uniref:uncharacterized protein n=1 Tax=Penicillium verhagenii TaxID=1562060 RepID=UPI0025457009|nr:uncharacterized protein N7466_005080 [Penicillium verhagenii]KAJ5935533.1 hypothetical protein N7466_005080 [Penicillium verhagenii]
MPLVIYKRSGRTHAVLPVTPRTTNSLIITLIYLQFLYCISFIARPLWSSAQEFPPFKYGIERTEKRVIDLILTIVPFSNYRSPNPSTTLRHSQSAQSAAYTSESRLTSDVFPNMLQQPVTAYTTPPTMPQCYPETALERTHSPTQPQVPDPKYSPRLAAGVGGSAAASAGKAGTNAHTVVDRYAKNNVPTYDTAVKRMSAPNRPRVSAITDLKEKSSPLQARSTPALHLARQSIHEHKMGASIEEQRSEDENERYAPVPSVQNISEMLHHGYQSYGAPAPAPATLKAHMPHIGLYSGQKSPVASLRSLVSLDGPADLSSARSSTEASGGTGEGSKKGVRMGHGTKCHSTESYPGNFPVSEGTEYSALATADLMFRERGTTTVRPFSDY